MIMSADNQILYNNIISNDEIGIYLDMCMGGGENNRIYYNNFINNGDENGQAYEMGGPLNHWNDGYPSGGNYWSDYSGLDNFSGPNQDIPGSDGIGDTPYDIPVGQNKDRYPLMEPYGDIPAIRQYCGITTKKAIDYEKDVAATWGRLKKQYDAWVHRLKVSRERAAGI